MLTEIEADRLRRSGYTQVGERTWRKPGKVIPGFVKTKNPRDFDGVVPPSLAEVTDEIGPTGERIIRLSFEC